MSPSFSPSSRVRAVVLAQLDDTVDVLDRRRVEAGEDERAVFGAHRRDDGPRIGGADLADRHDVGPAGDGARDLSTATMSGLPTTERALFSASVLDKFLYQLIMISIKQPLLSISKEA